MKRNDTSTEDSQQVELTAERLAIYARNLEYARDRLEAAKESKQQALIEARAAKDYYAACAETWQDALRRYAIANLDR